MKKHLLLFLFILICSALHSQDVVVTNNQVYIDSSAYQKKSDYARFRIAAAGGYSYRTIALPPGTSGEVRDYYRKSYNGFLYGVEFNYYFNKFIGMGLNYYASRFNPSGNNPDWYPDHISCKTRMQHVVPTVNFRVFDRQKQGALVAGVGIGYADYQTKFYQTNFHNVHVGTEKGWTVGMLLSVGYDIPISQMLAIYVQAALHGGVVTNFTLIDETTGKTETISVDDINDGVGLGKINLAIGLRFAK